MSINNQGNNSINSLKTIEIESITFVKTNRNRILKEAEIITKRKIKRFEYRKMLQRDEEQLQALLMSEIEQVKAFLEEPFIGHLLFTLENIDKMEVNGVSDFSEDQFQSAYEKALIIEYSVSFDELDSAIESIKNSTVYELRRTLEILYLQLFIHKEYYAYLMMLNGSYLFTGLVNSNQELFLPDLGNDSFVDEHTSIEEYENGVQWKGNNKTEFVQFVYALFEAGLITNDSREVTKLVEQLATIFKFDLGNNWQSNHSKSINNRNNDYEPEIFDRIKKAYSAYTEALMQGIKKRKK